MITYRCRFCDVVVAMNFDHIDPFPAPPGAHHPKCTGTFEHPTADRLPYGCRLAGATNVAHADTIT